MPAGASHHYDGLQDGPNLDDANLNSLDVGCNVHQSSPNALTVEVTAGVFSSSALIREEFPGATAQPVAASTLGQAVYLLPGGPPTLVIALAFPVGEHCPLAEVDTDGVEVIAISDKRPTLTSLVGTGPPSGVAGGVLAGTYPAPAFAPGALVDADVNAAAAIVESKLALNFATHSTANDPTTNEKAALAGTGVPTGLNPYVNNDDARLTDARIPVGHSSTHDHLGTDPLGVAAPAANKIPKALGTGKLDDGWINRQVRGDNRQHLTAEARTTTTNGPATPALKLQLVTGALTGTFRIDWQADYDNVGTAFAGGVRLQNATDAATLDQADYTDTIPVAGARRVSGFVELVLAGVSKTINIEHWDAAGANPQGIQRVRMEFRQVA